MLQDFRPSVDDMTGYATRRGVSRLEVFFLVLERYVRTLDR